MINIKNEYSVIGVMSGTSMDGLDVAYSRYYKLNQKWCFKLICADTYKYDQSTKKEFLKAFNKEIEIHEIDLSFGNLIADCVNSFISKNNLQVDLISSHGHTIFHEPEKGFSVQVGSGEVIAKRLKTSVVYNFRQQDIDFGGQGAPLVPVGDYFLFSNYESCLNLGGVVNISYSNGGLREAYDICPCNIILNFLSEKLGKNFDKKGLLAQQGQVNQTLLSKLNQLDYYQFSHPKSLGKEYVDAFFLPLISASDSNVLDLLATVVEHIAIQIGNVLSNLNISNCLFTGGGVFNEYLISRIQFYSIIKIIIPSKDIINYKEAIIFGFLGILKMLNKNNCFSSSTGALKDHSSGQIYII